MDFKFGPEHDTLRQEVRDFVKKELPQPWDGFMGEVDGPEELALDKKIRKRLGQKGWLTFAWPKEYGGGGADHIMQMVLNEELSYHRVPGKDGSGNAFIGPCIIVHGSEAQKKQHVPPIAQGEVVWCQGFSEPNAGSDLASLQTSAVKDGDDYIINGTKIWTTFAHYGDWMHILCRTDPNAEKHKGITYFLLDMKTPGITIKPLLNVADGHIFNQCFFDNVRVPASNILGQLNRGWYAAATALDFERSSVASSAQSRRLLDDSITYLKSEKKNPHAPINKAVSRYKLADLLVQSEAGKVLNYRVGWMQRSGKAPNAEASVAKVFSTEFNQRLARTLMEMIGLKGLHYHKDKKRSPVLGRIEHHYLHSIASTVGSGTSEIQRNVIAWRGLGLPR